MIVLWVAIAIFLVFALVVVVGAPYVPTLKADLAAAFDELYVIGKHDVVLDVGSGDGTVLREVSRRGGKAVGYEINPILVGISYLLSRRDSKVSTKLRNFWTEHFPADTTLVYTFVVSRDTKRIAKKMQSESNRLQRPLYLLSYGAKIPGIELLNEKRAHHLYRVTPLQKPKAQV